MDKLIRKGNVSSINYEDGTIRVVYPGLDDAVTDEFPVFSCNDEYKMPEIGAEVLVLHLSNNMAAGVVIGKCWDGWNKPPESGADVFRKELAQAIGEAYLRYGSKEAELVAPEIRLTCSEGSVTVSELLKLVQG